MRRYLLIVLLMSTVAAGAAPLQLQVACEDKPDFPGLLGRGNRILSVNPGTAVELLQLLAASLKFKYKLSRYPWKRALEMGSSGEADLLIYASWSRTRADKLRFPLRYGRVDYRRRYATRTYTLYRRKGDKLFWKNGKIYNLTGTIGAPRGYSIVIFLQSRSIAVDVSDSTGQDLRKLLHKRVQGVVALRTTATMYLKRHPQWAKQLEAAGTVKQKAYYFVFSKRFYAQHPRFAERFWNELARLRRSQRYRAIVAKYQL